jgi:hypothetical protein
MSVPRIGTAHISSPIWVVFLWTVSLKWHKTVSPDIVIVTIIYPNKYKAKPILKKQIWIEKKVQKLLPKIIVLALPNLASVITANRSVEI